jgi:hypothetical protein
VVPADGRPKPSACRSPEAPSRDPTRPLAGAILLLFLIPPVSASQRPRRVARRHEVPPLSYRADPFWKHGTAPQGWVNQITSGPRRRVRRRGAPCARKNGREPRLAPTSTRSRKLRAKHVGCRRDRPGVDPLSFDYARRGYFLPLSAPMASWKSGFFPHFSAAGVIAFCHPCTLSLY